MNFLYEYYNGLANLGIWGYLIVAVLWLHLTLIAITLYFHRDQTHRAVDLHPALRHFFRFWLWINTGASTREWVAVHRKHHALCEREGDPHSPRLFGLKTVLTQGAELYRVAARDPETLEKYAKGTPNDWLENNLYHHPVRSYYGITALVIADLLLFGVPGILMIALQLSNMPFLAAGIINGLCHAKGYRNFETDDASTNLWPIGILVAGEELHNNHHAFPTSARFSMRPHEFDIGWMYLKVLAALGLANTVTGNWATNYGGGGNGSSVFNNCIVYYNTALVGGADFVNCTMNNSCTTLPAAAFGTITNAPLFLDYAGGDLRLQSNSPCINAGTNTYVQTITDLDSNPRIVGGTVDMGAYEIQSPALLSYYVWLQGFGLPTVASAVYADTDGDHLNNWQEWRADTIPTNVFSALRMVTVTNGTPGLQVTWQSVPTRNYWLDRSTHLASLPPFSTVASNLAGQVGTTTFTDTNATGPGPFFYRVGVQQ